MITPLATLFVVASLQDRAYFPTPVVVEEAAAGEFRAHGDFDGDGDDDLLWYRNAPLNPTHVSVWTNDGQGSFTPGAELAFNFPGSYTSGELDPYVGDYNGDGQLDFAIGRAGANGVPGQGVEFFLGDGVGGFPTRLLQPLAFPPLLSVGQADSDPADELLVSYSDTSFNRFVGWVEVTGGTTVAQPPLQHSVPGVPFLRIVIALDLDGDGIDDGAAITATLDEILLLPTVGGSPTAGTSYAIPVPMQNANTRLYAGDLEGDGDEDLVFLRSGTLNAGPLVQVFENTPGGLIQHPHEEITSTAGTFFASSETGLADWDGDGWLDIVKVSGSFRVLSSDGDLTFSDGFEAGGTGQRGGGGVFDVNADGDLDQVGGYTVFFGDGTFDYSEAEGDFLQNGLVATDVEGDGDIDLRRGVEGSSYYENDGAGNLELAPEFPGDVPIAPGIVRGQQLGYGDFDGDGKAEQLFEYGVFQGFIFPTFVPYGIVRRPILPTPEFGDYIAAAPYGFTVAPPSGTFSLQWPAADLDGDGDLDLAILDGYLENDGNGRLEVFVPAWSGEALAIDDFDSDGSPEVLLGRDSGGLAQIYLGEVGGSDTSLAVVTNEPRVTVRDADGDGDLDVLFADPDQLGLGLIENLGGSFGLPTFVPRLEVLTFNSVAFHDADGDGELELFAPRAPGVGSPFPQRSIAVLERVGPGLEYELDVQYLVTQVSPINGGFADLDQDGDLDAWGAFLLRGTRTPELEGGAIQQQAAGVAGTGGAIPLLGASGPVLSSTRDDELLLVRGLGGTTVFLGFGTQAVELSDVPFAGLTLFIGDPTVLPPFVLNGTPGLAGGGSFALPLPSVPILAGSTFFHQAFLVDPQGPAGLSSTNRLSVTYGL